MANWGKADFEELKALQERLQRLEDTGVDKFCHEASKELAARLLALVIPRTPVGIYDSEQGKVGGTLRRGWTAGQDASPKEFANSLPVYKNGNNYTIVVKNNVEYASYVEFGHRQTPGRYVPAIGKRLKESFVEGHYMLTFSEDDLRSIAPNILRKKLDKFLAEALNGKN